jgi:hypothetical protein
MKLVVVCTMRTKPYIHTFILSHYLTQKTCRFHPRAHARGPQRQL